MHERDIEAPVAYVIYRDAPGERFAPAFFLRSPANL